MYIYNYIYAFTHIWSLCLSPPSQRFGHMYPRFVEDKSCTISLDLNLYRVAGFFQSVQRLSKIHKTYQDIFATAPV